jgi:hypothetical protein
MQFAPGVWQTVTHHIPACRVAINASASSPSVGILGSILGLKDGYLDHFVASCIASRQVLGYYLEIGHHLLHL